MRLVISATAIGPTNAGAGQYARELLPRLIPLLAGDGHRAHVLLSKGATLPGIDNCAKIVRLPALINRKISRVLLEHLLPSFITLGADVFLSLDSRLPLAPVWAKQKLVVMHDIQVLRHLASPGDFPMDYTPGTFTYTCMGVKRAIRGADGIITVSRFVAEELQRYAALPSQRIVTILNGVDHQRFRPVQDSVRLEKVRKTYRLPDDFYLFVGQPSRQKNLRLIIQAYASGSLDRDLRLPVVIAWDMRRSELFEPTLALIEQSGLADFFRFAGYVSDADLPYVYSAARALLYPSLYEGFGLPLLEAMACGVPAIASNRASIPEVVGDAALLIDPGCPESLAEALRKLSDQRTRRCLIEKGLQRAQAFSWERTAQLMADRISIPGFFPASP